MTNYTKARKNYISEASRAISGHSTTHCVCKWLASQLEGEYQQKKMRNKCTAHLVTRRPPLHAMIVAIIKYITIFKSLPAS